MIKELPVYSEPPDNFVGFKRLYPTYEQEIAELKAQVFAVPTNQEEARKNKKIHEKIKKILDTKD